MKYPSMLLVLMGAMAGTSGAAVVNVDFGDNYELYEGQGEYADVGNDYWNLVSGTDSSSGPDATDLIASDGSNVTAVAVSLTGLDKEGGSGDLNALFGDYNYVSGYGTMTLELSGLDARGGYGLYVYCQGNRETQNATVTFGGESKSTSGSITEIGENINYVVFDALQADDDGIIRGTIEPLSQEWAAINGFQLIDLEWPLPTLSTAAGVTTSGDYTVEIEFSESVTGLEESDFEVSNGSVVASSLSGSGASWSVEISPEVNGDVSVTLAGSAVQDGEGNPNPESGSLITTYISPGSDQPVATLSTATNKVYGDFSVQVDFSEAVTGLALSDFEISGGTLSGLTGSGDSYSMMVSPNFGGDVIVSLPRNSVTDIDGDNLQNPASDELVTAYHIVVTVSDPAGLLPYLTQDNVHATLAPGTYTIDAADTTGSFGVPQFEFWGNNSTYDFTDVTINYAEDIYLADLSMSHYHVYGNSNVLLNLTSVDLCDKYGQQGLDGGVHITMDGRANRVEGFHFTTRGSWPYGYGEAFGKGGPYVVPGIKKHSTFLLRGEYNHVKDCTIIHRAFSHALYMQACSYATVEGCYIEGEMRATDDMLAEAGTGTVGDQYDFMTYWGYTIPSGYMMCLGEEGIRAYNGGTTYIDGVWSEAKGTDNPTIINNTIKNMRGGVTLSHATGTKYVSGCTAIGCEQGFAVGTGIIEDCAADAQYGSVLGVAYESDSGTIADITILPYEGEHMNGSGHLAFILGSGHNITLRGLEENPDQSLTIGLGGDKRVIGMLDSDENYAADDIILNNLTGYPVVLDDNSSGNTGQSIGSVSDAGTGNSFAAQDWGVKTNLAFYGTVTQSSTAYDGIAGLATDQNTSGVWSEGSVTHTASEDQPWWKVDLGGLHEIDEIRIWNRTDTGVSRLSDYDVTILDDADAAVWSSYQADYPDPMTALDAEGAIGQSIMIQLRGSSAMNIAEVQVYGTSLDADSRPVGHWKLDEDYGSTACDDSGNGMDGTVESAEWVSGYDGGALDFNGSNSIVYIPGEAFGAISNEVSIAFWAYGDDSQPVANSAFYAVNSSGGRVLNIHLPYSNGNVYWDAGADSSGYDRIYRSASTNEYKGSWAHWVFTKNADTGAMRIFCNGALWHSGSGMTNMLTGIVSAAIGGQVDGNYYAGQIDDVRLYKIALSADEVTELYESDAVPKVGEFTAYEDLGTPSLAGSVSYAGGVYTVEAGGSDIQGASDSGYFVSDSHSGDSELVTQVTSVENTHTWAKAGPMFRESSSASAKNVFLAVRPDNQISMQYRESTGGSTGYGDPVGGTDVKWVKLVRSGDLFTGLYSADGVSWTEIASVTVDMNNEIERGLAVTSHNDSSLCTAVFSMVPPAPGALTAEAVDEDEIDLLWSSSVSATTYNLKRAAVSGGAYASVDGSLLSTNYNDTDLSAGTEYFYVVCGEYCGVEGDASAEVSAVPSAVIVPEDVVIGSADVSVDGSDFSLVFSNSVLGHGYRVLAADDLADSDWQAVSVTNAGNGGLLTIEVPLNAADTNRFYKLETWRQ